MSNVRLFDKSFKPFIPNERLEEAIDKVAEKINHDFNGCTDCPVLLCVLNGSLMFTSELMKRLTFNCELVCIKLSSYNGTHTTGNVREVMGLTRSIEGKRIIVVEDIVDSGNTIVALKELQDPPHWMSWLPLLPPPPRVLSIGFTTVLSIHIEKPEMNAPRR